MVSGHSLCLDDDKDGAKYFEDFYHADAWMPLNCSQQNGGLSYNFQPYNKLYGQFGQTSLNIHFIYMISKR